MQKLSLMLPAMLVLFGCGEEITKEVKDEKGEEKPLYGLNGRT